MHTSVTMNFCVLLHFPKVQKKLNFLIKYDIFRYGPLFSFSWGVPHYTNTWFLQLIWIKRCCFERSWVMFWGPKHMAPKGKISEFGFQA